MAAPFYHVIRGEFMAACSSGLKELMLRNYTTARLPNRWEWRRGIICYRGWDFGIFSMVVVHRVPLTRYVRAASPA